MVVATPRRIGELARKAFDILMGRREGVPMNALLQEIETALPLSAWERTKDLYHGIKPFEEMLQAGAIPLIKAGWMTETGGVWKITEKGVQAHSELADPEDFIRKSANQSLKGWLIVHLPRLFAFLSRVKTQFDIERQMIGRLGLGLLLASSLGRTPAWQKRLPLQAPRRFALPGVDLKNYDELVDYLNSRAVDYRCAGHTLYLPPEAASTSAFAAIMSQYPADAGLKITKNTGGVDGPYLFGGVRNRKISVMYNRVTYDRARLVLVANLLFSKQLSSRLYDLIEIVCGQQVWTAYVVRHLAGQVPTEAECKAGIDRIKQLEQQGLLKVSLSQGYDDEDFSCPTCNNNAFMDDGKFCYIDFQSFLLINYQHYLKQVKVSAYEAAGRGAGNTSGDTPNSPQAGASTSWEEEPEFTATRRLLQQAGIEARDRVVMELGCGAGANIAGYLKLGAAWCHGWAGAAVTEQTERLLLALGCTRFSLSQWRRDRALEEQWPEFLTPMLEGCIFSVSSDCSISDIKEEIREVPWAYIILQDNTDADDRGARLASEFGSQLNIELKATASFDRNDGGRHVLRLFERTSTFIQPGNLQAQFEGERASAQVAT
jgi:hypothetical protein